MKKLLTALLVLMSGAFAAHADSKAQYPGGEDAMNEFIAKNIVYPEVALENDIEGNVLLSVVIKPDGSIGAIKVKRLIDHYLEKEAIRVVNAMPKWTPAEKDGVAVEDVVEIPVKFRLSSK